MQPTRSRKQGPGRNDPCPCGSGKKFKQCCQALPQYASPRLVPEAIPKTIQAAWLNFQHGRSSQAQALCQQILEICPNHADAIHLLGVMALHEADFLRATKLLEKAVRLNPTHPEYLNNLGLAWHEQGRLEEAERCYRKAIAAAPFYANAWFNLHALLLDPTDMEPAIQCLQKVVALAPTDAEAHFMLGALLEYVGDARAATPHFEIATQAGALQQARLDAWRYFKQVCPLLPPLLGSNWATFRLGLEKAPAAGLVLEFGVRHGNSIRQIAALAGQEVHGFDSFQGLPEAWHDEAKGSYTTGGKLPEVPHNVRLHVGWFSDVLPEFLEHHSEPIRLLNIDCDIYSSTKTVLDLLAPRIVPGSVILFDEYIGNAHWREDEFKAFQEAVVRYGWQYEYLCFSLYTKQVGVRIVGG
ncbi:MAG: tetratricopeptide repeat protein [Methylophilaceae bacterium]|nr:tetratricopeptide repeat protein [Methylophilaceae bacterium]